MALLAAACTGGGDGTPVATTEPEAVGGDVAATATSVVPAESTTTTAPFAPPEPTLTPIVQWSYDHVVYVQRCLEEAGIATEVSEHPPSLALPHGFLATPRTDRISETCWEAGLDEGWLLLSPFDESEEGNRLLYDIFLEIHECLVEIGYPTVEPPSEEAFAAQGRDLWNPYSGSPFGMTLTVTPHAREGGVSDAQRRQLEAQATCGASESSIYSERLRAGEIEP